jgi:glycosyltransferase involved in cell wall biosynthesis
MNMSKGYVGISACEDARSSEFWANFLQLELPELVTKPEVARGSCIADNRNRLAARAIQLEADWIFYVDDDQLFHPLALKRLLNHIENNHNIDVISGLYLMRGYPFEPVAFDKPSDDPSNPQGVYRVFLNHLDKSHGLIEMMAVGAGALLVRRRVLEELEKPLWRLGQIEKSEWGDDINFCYRVREAGFRIYCDLDERVGHKVQGALWPNYDEKTKKWHTTLVVNDQPIVQLPQITVQELEEGVR